MKKITLFIFFVPFIVSFLGALPPVAPPLIPYEGIQGSDLEVQENNVSWWQQRSEAQKVLLITAGVAASMALLTIGAKKYGPSFFKKTDAQIIQEKEAEALKAALTDVSFLIDNDTRSRYNLASLSLSDNDVFEANRKFYLIFPLTSQKIFFDEEDPDNLDKLLETNNELRKQLNPKTLFLWDYRKVEGDKNNKVQDNKKNALIPVKLIPINMRFNSTDTAVEFLESHPLLPEVEKGELLTYDKSIIRKYFRLENHPFSQACIKYGNCLILLPQNKKD